MNSKLTKVAIFLMGAAVGSILTWRYIRKKAKEDISEKDLHEEKQETDNIEIKAAKAKEKPGLIEYAENILNRRYENYYENEKEETTDVNKPYVITPEEFGELENYDTITLMYYSDQILTDDDDELVEDVESTVGFESLNHFGEYEDDSVFVRNDNFKCDFEILLDQRKYIDVLKKKPPRFGE